MNLQFDWRRQIHRLTLVTLLAALVGGLGLGDAQAGLTMQMGLNRGNYQGYQYYQFGPYLNTNNLPPSVPFGDYFVVSPGWPTNANASANLFHYDTNGFNQVSSTAGVFSLFDAPDFNDSFIQNITNGLWSIYVTNTVTTNLYHFTVTADIGSNAIPLVVITYPTNGAVHVPAQPIFTWQSPANYGDQIIYGPNFGYDLPLTQTNWSGATLNEGINSFTVDTYYLSSNDVVCSVPLDSQANPLTSWVSTWHVWDFANVQFSVGIVDPTGTPHTLVAWYTWDNTNVDGTASGADSSGNGLDLNFSGSFGSQGGVTWSPDAEVGLGALQFIDGDGNSGGYAGWNPTPTNLLAAVAGSFSISCWLATTQNFDYGGDYAFNGAGIVSAYTGNLANDVVPLALTGGQVAFNTGGSVEDDTLTSNGSVNDGNYHHVVVTRNQVTGQKIIYVDGVLDSFSSGTTNLLTDSQLLTLGAIANATDPNALDATYYNGYAGLLDDLQIYSGVLSSNEVAWIYANPGTTLSNTFLDTLVVTASSTYGPVPFTVQFTSPGVDSAGNTITNWLWNFGDGATSTNQNPAHVYLTAGLYAPSLVAESTGAIFPVVTPPGVIKVTTPELNITISPPIGPVPLTVQFASPGVDSAGNVVTNWLWDFGDGTTSSAQNPSHVYTRVGAYSPNLLALSTLGQGPLSITDQVGVNVTTNPTPAFHTLYSFTPAFGADPNSQLVLAGNTLYGTVWGDNQQDDGTIFSINTDGTGFTNLYWLNLATGGRPDGVILSGTTLYGSAAVGGPNGGGTVFALGTNGLGFTNLLNLTANADQYSGSYPFAPLVLSGATLYGSTWFGGYFNHGTLFGVNTNGTPTGPPGGIFHSFQPPNNNNANPDGIIPETQLIVSGGILYGTTLDGGNYGRGTVFSVDPNNPNSFAILHYFTLPDQVSGTNQDGSNPTGLVLAGNTLYGTTAAGGSSGNGTVFAVNPDGSGFTNLFNFPGGNAGASPTVWAVSGNVLYGSTTGGGAYTNGTLFALHTDGTGFTTLYSFTGGYDGSSVSGLLVSGSTLYGTAGRGGIAGNGTVFSFTLQPPQLTITPAGTNVLLTWPSLPSGYTLQTSLQLGAAAAWTPVSPLPVIINGLNVVTNAISGTQKFYRLSQ